MLDAHVAEIRRFNRFYTKRIGVLQEHLLSSRFSLSEARVLYELAREPGTTASRLADELALDPGYLSRILARFEAEGLVERVASPSDGRSSCVSLSEKGRAAFAPLDAGSRQEVEAMLRRVPRERVADVLAAMRTIEEALGPEPSRSVAYVLRPHRPGDGGWVVAAHAAVYAGEHGWDAQFEAFVAKLVARFIEHYDPQAERCWIAERDGRNVGSVFVFRKSKTVAQLRMLIVDPGARGSGIGARLVDEAVRFARDAGYRKMVLWTNDVLHAARRLYERAGFRMTHEERHHSFGRDLVGQTWELSLRSGN